MKEIIILAVIVLIVVGVIYWRFRKNFKFLNAPSVCLVTGGVKCGKSKLCVKLSQQDFKSRHRKWVWHKRLAKFLHKDFKEEEPLYYTNCYITFGNSKRESRTGKKHKLDKCIRQLTKESLLREKRLNYGSVVYINEVSLLADSMDYTDKARNVELSLFCKLFGHETKGGTMYIDTQSVLDMHYSFKRVLSTYYFIQKKRSFFKLFDVLYIREMINSENGVNSFDDDVDNSTRKVLIPFWWNYRYDRYEWSYLTDDLSVSEQAFVKKHGIVSFNQLYVKLGDKRKKEEKKGDSK